MNNIQKAFKNKAKMGLRMANGGVLEDPFGFNNVLSNRNQRERQTTNPLEKIDGAIAMGNAVEGSNLTMSEKAALGMGTTSADASALRQKTSALSTLREGMLQQPVVGEQYDNWQRQNGLRAQNFADGGVVDPVEALLARTKANYGVSNASQPAAQAAPQPTPQPTQQPAPQPAAPAKDNSGGLFGKAMRGLRGRAEAANFANGGIVKLSGPGTGTSDDIPMKVNKGGRSLDVNVSNGEALAVLPAKTAQNPAAVDAVNDIIYQTNGKPPKGLRAGVTNYAADGVIIVGSDGKPIPPEPAKPVQQPVNRALSPEARAYTAEREAAAAVQNKLTAEAAANRAAMDATKNAKTVVGGAQASTTSSMPTSKVPTWLKYEGVGYNVPKPSLGGIKSAARAVGRTAMNVAKPLGGAAAVAGAGLQGYETGSDFNEVWQNDKTDLPTKIAATLEGAGNVAGNILTLGMVQNPVSGIARWINDETAMDRALAGTNRERNEREKPKSTTSAIPIPTHAATQETVDPAQATAAVRADLQNRADSSFAQQSGVDPEIAKLAAGNENRTAGFGTLRDATQFTVPQGSGGGVITGAADKNGLRRAMVVLPNGSPTQANPNAPRDIYGNDMSRTNDMKRQLAEIQRQNTDSDLASGLPFYQQRGLRALAADNMRAETEAARGKGGASALDLAKFNLDVAKFQHDLKRTDNMQGNADRKDDADRKSANVKRVTEMFDRFAPVSGLKGDDLKNAVSRRNEFEQAFYAANGGQMPTDPAKFDEQLPGMMRQARLTVAMNDAVRNRGLWDKVKNLMHLKREPRTGTSVLPIDEFDDGKTIHYYGVPLSAEEVLGDDADLLQAYQERIAKTKARKSN